MHAIKTNIDTLLHNILIISNFLPAIYELSDSTSNGIASTHFPYTMNVIL